MKSRTRFNVSPEGDSGCLYTSTGLKVSEGFERIVIGGRGPYIEFQTDQLFLPVLHIPQHCQYRVDSPRVYYIEYRTKDEAGVKVYHQKKVVSYADYKIGLWYISPSDLYLENGLPVVIPSPQTPSLFSEQV
ncbi:hypothetical protein LCGC14_2916390 [marine sediment metagenome]|uniref:Uncharacterized protein n=1 Tax=marine sediment metagenome TaxID=412755 RepID=A0A0F8YBX7_9ZZZZ